MIDRLLRTREAAHILATSKGTLEKWRCIGKGPIFTRIGGQIRYAESDLTDYITKNRASSTSAPPAR